MLNQKKIIIVAPHFPPSALPPSQRIRLLLKHIYKFGYFPTIFTTFPKYREELEDPWMTNSIGHDFELITLKSLNQKITRKIGVGDLGIRFIPFLFPSLLKYCVKNKSDFILYPVPPWYLLAIAPLIKRLTHVPYGIDFIDPWYVENKQKKTFKQKVSQWIAYHFEKKAVRKASVIYSVSEGINLNLIKRYSQPAEKFHAIPYGVELSDYENQERLVKQERVITIRYIGAVWNNAYPVIDALLCALSKAKESKPIEIEFIGTSYSGKELSKPQLTRWFDQYAMNDYAKEYSNRIPYPEALKLNLSSDIILLFGGMEQYYAASKLMGTIASQRPFLAFFHEDSFPAKFLQELNYPYLLTYSASQNNLPQDNIESLATLLNTLISQLSNYAPIDLSNPAFLNHTAYGMTKRFIDPINAIITHEN